MTISLVIFTLTLNVNIIAYSKSTYLRQVQKLNWGQFSKVEKETIANDLWRIINFGVTSKEVFTNSIGFFSAKEITHLKDVAEIFKFIRIICLISLVITILLSAYFIKKRKRIEKFFLIGILSILIFGIVVLLTFEKSFILFHIISFDNDLWLLNPETDLLINIFQEDFFVHSFIKVILFSIIELVVVFFIEECKRRRRKIH